jgi:hypothetical protein
MRRAETRDGPRPSLRGRVESHAPLPPCRATTTTCVHGHYFTTTAYSTSLVYAWSAPGFEPRGISQPPPSPPPARVRVEGAFYAFGCSSDEEPRSSKAEGQGGADTTCLTQNKPPPPTPFWVGRMGREFVTSRGSNPGAGLGYTRGSGGRRVLMTYGGVGGCWWVG